MSLRQLRRARAGSAAGLIGCLLATLPALADEPRIAPAPADTTADAVHILRAERDGQIALNIRGQGEDRVRFEVRNNTDKRLKVILPPGLVAMAATGQRGGGGGGGFQSMGLGVPTNKAGSFGEFRSGSAGFKSMPVDAASANEGLVIPAGSTVDFHIPSVCLNFGIPTPTPHDQFRLVDVDDYTPDARARKALRSLSTLGTSQTVAQAVAWHVFNGMSFDQLLGQSVKKLNTHEVALASRFVDALDRTSGDLVDPAYMTEGRLFVRIQGEGALAKESREIAEQIQGMKLLGLPLRAVTDEVPAGGPSAIYLQVQLSAPNGATRGKVIVRVKSFDSTWRVLGTVPLKDVNAASELRAETLVDALDRSIAQAFVTARVTAKHADSTALRIENRLPFTLSQVTLQAGNGDRMAPVTLPGLGIAPMRNGAAAVPAARATIDRVELNGL